MAPDPIHSNPISSQEVLSSLSKIRSCTLEGKLTAEAHLLSQIKIPGRAIKLHRSRLGGMMAYSTAEDGTLNLSLVSRDGQIHNKSNLGKYESEVSARVLALEGTTHWIIKADFNGEISCTPFTSKSDKYVRGKAQVLAEPKGFASALGFEPYQQKLAIGMYGGEIYLADLASKAAKSQRILGLPKHDLFSALDFSPACEQLAVAADHSLYVLALDSDSKKNTVNSKILLKWHADSIITAISYSAWDSLIAVSAGSKVHILRVEEEKGRHSVKEVAHYEVGRFVSSVRFNHLGTEVWFGTGDGLIGVISPNKPRALPALAA